MRHMPPSSAAAAAAIAAVAIVTAAATAVAAAAAIGTDSTAGNPTASFVLPPAYAQGGDAYVITDLGNTFKIERERPPEINWTRVLLERIGDAERRAIESDAKVRENASRIIQLFINNNERIINELRFNFSAYGSTIDSRIQNMIDDNDEFNEAINASIDRLEQEIRRDEQTTVYQQILDKEAAVSVISSQVHYVYNDQPANIMVCTADDCDMSKVKPFMAIPAGSSYTVYNDPSWLPPNLHAISPLHHNARYTDGDTLTITTIPGNQLRLHHIYLGLKGVGEPMISERELSTVEPNMNFLVLSCTDQYSPIYCSNEWGSVRNKYVPRATYLDRAIDLPAGFPYHVNMISKATEPLPPPGFNLTAGTRIPLKVPYCTTSDGTCELTASAIAEWKKRFGTPRMPFVFNETYTTFSTAYNTDHLIEAGISGGESTPNRFDRYFSTTASGEVPGAGSTSINPRLDRYFAGVITPPGLPYSGTPQTWPNCEHLPTCFPMSFAFGEFVPRGSPLNTNITWSKAGIQITLPAYSEIPDSWRVFLSPQLHIRTWSDHNTLQGTHTAVPQFIDRMNRQLLVPTFTAGSSPPASEAGKLYDIRGYARIPFAPETPWNVSHVSLRPTASLLDADEIGREYIADTANTPANLYNIKSYEFEGMGLANCEVESQDVVCDRRTTNPVTLDREWRPCTLLRGGSSGCATHSDIGEIVAGRADFEPEANAMLPQLEGVYRDALYVPLVQGYSGFRLVIDDIAVFTEYKDIRSNDHIFLSPKKSANVGRSSIFPIHHAEANVTVTSQAVAPRDGDMNILAVVSATGTLDLRNEYTMRDPPPPPVPRAFDPLSAFVDITINGEHYATRSLGINEYPSVGTNNTRVEDGDTTVVTRRVLYEYPSFVFAGTSSVPVSAGDHVLFELTAKIAGDIDSWSPTTGTLVGTKGLTSARISIDAASIMMGVG